MLDAFGDAETALHSLNQYACNLEDRLIGVAQEYQQAIAAIQYLQQRDAATTTLLTNPNELAPYYLELEKIWGDLPSQQAVQQLPAGYAQAEGFNANPALFAAQQSSQYAQSLNQGAGLGGVPPQVRPEFPAMPVGQGGGQLDLNSVPPSERWKAIDMLSKQGAFRGSRLVF